MKILFVYSGNSITGQNRIVENQASSFISKGIEIKLFPIKGKGFFGYLKNIGSLSKFLRSGEFDIIHAHYGLSGLVSFLAKKKEKLVVSFMGSDLVEYNNKNVINKLCNRILIIPNIIFARYFFSFSIVKSKEMAMKLMRNTEYAIIPNGVCFERFHPVDQKNARNELGFEYSKKIVLFVSDPSRPEKNYALAVQSCELLNNERITLIPVFNQRHDILPLYYNSADVLLLTSLYEGSPNVVKEAMACGCPVVSTKVGDVEWLLGDSQGHYLTTIDPNDVAEKLKSALLNDKRTQGRDRLAKLGLDSETTASKIMEVYYKVYNKSSSKIVNN